MSMLGRGSWTLGREQRPWIPGLLGFAFEVLFKPARAQAFGSPWLQLPGPSSALGQVRDTFLKVEPNMQTQSLDLLSCSPRCDFLNHFFEVIGTSEHCIISRKSVSFVPRAA